MKYIMLLMLCCLVALTACAKHMDEVEYSRVDVFSESEASSTVSTEESDVSEYISYVQEAQTYLTQKYQQTFVLENDYGQLMEFRTDYGVVHVATLSYIRQQPVLDQALYTEAFADDAYLVFNQKLLQQYYATLIDKAFGETELVVTYSAIAMPSNVSLDMPVEDVQMITDRAGFVVHGLVQNNVDNTDGMKKAIKDTQMPTRITLTHVQDWSSRSDVMTHVARDDSPYVFRENLSSWMCTPEEYLEQKYGRDFREYKSVDIFGSLLELPNGYSMFITEGIEDKFLVANQEAIQKMSPRYRQWYTEAYADNGYYIFHKEELTQYCKEILGENVTLIQVMQFFPDVMPSKLTPDVPVEDAIQALLSVMGRQAR